MSEITLTVPQAKIFTCTTRHRVNCSGRRFGKSTEGLAELDRAARYHFITGEPLFKQTVWMVAPTHNMAKTIFWSALINWYPPQWIRRKNQTDLEIELVNGSSITLKSGDNPDTLRGPMTGLDFVLLEEFSEQKEEIWPVIYPQVADTGGRILIQGTPKGYNHFYDKWDWGNNPDRTHWANFQFTTLDGGNVPPEEVEQAKEDMSVKHFRQEFEASFESMTSKIYYDFDPRLNCSEKAVDDGESIIYIGMDFNVSMMCANASIQKDGKLVTFDEIVLYDSNTNEMAREINKRYKDRRVVVIPDASGRSRSTSANGGTDFTILRNAGLELYDMKKNPDISDRINEVNAVICNAKGDRRALIHPKCQQLVKSLSRHTYKNGTSIPDKDAGWDHMNDAYGYKIHSLYPIKTQTASTMRMPR